MHRRSCKRVPNLCIKHDLFLHLMLSRIVVVVGWRAEKIVNDIARSQRKLDIITSSSPFAIILNNNPVFFFNKCKSSSAVKLTHRKESNTNTRTHSIMPKRRKAVPLIPPNNPSRKQARRITTLFHKYTRQLDAALAVGDQETIETLERNIVGMGGRPAYQRASQVSTSYFSTSKKWVLGVLGRNGWLHGIKLSEGDEENTTTERKKPRRTTRLLEIGAINTDLVVDATQKYPQLSVRAIDLNSMHPAIEEADFSKIPLDTTYDVLVCSMVLNCVTTASERGKMLLRLSYFLEIDGILFLTIPKSCLTLSPYMDKDKFEELLGDCGLEVTDFNETPKISFFQCRKIGSPSYHVSSKWSTAIRLYRGKKYRNDFAVTFDERDLQISAAK